MAGENGSARPYIATKPPLSADVRNCNFYVLMEALYRRYGAPARIFPCVPSQPEIVRFSSNTNIGFPGTDLSVLSSSQNGQYLLQTRFLGFSGSQSPLPGYYLDRMAQESAQNEDGLKEFLDLSATAGHSLPIMPGANTATTSAFVTAVLTPFTAHVRTGRAG